MNWINGLLSLIFLFGVIAFRIYLKYVEFSDYMFYGGREMDSIHTKYDYIVVGLGTAGSIVARRLSEDGHNKVLALEAGAYGSNFMNIPALSLLLQKSTFDWQYRTVPQKFACKGLKDNASTWPMGKVVGGTHMLNNMIYTRGHPDDYKSWYKHKKGFSYELDILPYFKKLENYVNTNSNRTYGSALISDAPFLSNLNETLLEAARYLGLPILEDHITVTRGFSKPKATVLEGQRWTTANQLLTVKRHNLVIRAQVMVEKILFRDKYEARAVKYQYRNEHYYAAATKAVILCAGTVGSPKILMLSGIGLEKNLVSVGIKPLVNLPVGENLQDHVSTGLDLILVENFTINTGLTSMLNPKAVYQYLFENSGAWTTVACDVLGFFNLADLVSHDSKSVALGKDTEKLTHSNNTTRINLQKDVPQLEFMVIPLGASTDKGVVLNSLVGMKKHVWKNYFEKLGDQTVLSILPVLLHPKSRGTITLRDKNVTSHPVIDPKYFHDPQDLKRMVQGIQLIKKYINTEPLKKIGAKLNEQVFPGCESFIFDSEEYWECYVRHLTLTTYHPVGTCKMGEGISSVVDFDFKVRGTNNLYVIDGSVMPSLTSGNPNAAIMMFAEKGVDTIKYLEYLRNGQCNIEEVFLPGNMCHVKVVVNSSCQSQGTGPFVIV